MKYHDRAKKEFDAYMEPHTNDTNFEKIHAIEKYLETHSNQCHTMVANHMLKYLKREESVEKFNRFLDHKAAILNTRKEKLSSEQLRIFRKEFNESENR